MSKKKQLQIGHSGRAAGGFALDQTLPQSIHIIFNILFIKITIIGVTYPGPASSAVVVDAVDRAIEALYKRLKRSKARERLLHACVRKSIAIFGGPNTCLLARR